MDNKGYILAIDQGTTSSRAVFFDSRARVKGQVSQEFTQYYPQPGWVEHDAMEIWRSVKTVLAQVLKKTKVGPDQVKAIGITNQRETCLLWDRKTGKPVSRAIVWQCRRTAPMCEALKKKGLAPFFRQRTGLVLDAYFSGTKAAWILDHVPGARKRALKGELAFGTIDTWLLWNLSGGKIHATDHTNASRTLLFNIHKGEWDKDILKKLSIPVSLLPTVRPSSYLYGFTSPAVFGHPIPLCGVVGDQQAALFGQACFEPGELKNTYGTGCFLLLNTGNKAYASRHGLLTTLAADDSSKLAYALEGSVFIAGAGVQWLRDSLHLIQTAAETEGLAKSIPDNNGVYLVPAFVGLGAPYWDMNARGALVGLTRGATRAHVARATLEAIAYQTREVVEVMQRDMGIRIKQLQVDGGAVRNDFLMQFQADLLGIPVVRPKVIETTALGAAFLAGLASGFWKDKKSLAKTRKKDKTFWPKMPKAQADRLYEGWKQAVKRVLLKTSR